MPESFEQNPPNTVAMLAATERHVYGSFGNRSVGAGKLVCLYPSLRLAMPRVVFRKKMSEIESWDGGLVTAAFLEWK